jgi:hypothetical protein
MTRAAYKAQWVREDRKKNPEKYRAKDMTRHSRRQKERRDHVTAAKVAPCTDCGNTFPPCAMDFHHRDPSTKKAAIARMVYTTAAIKVIDEEIAKCDLLCANCHRIRHHG